MYGKKFANRFVQRKLKPTSETQDAIIFEVDWSEYVCKCKIQGSDEYVNAYFPRNEATIPSWMKPGNAVRILHRAGVRGHTEVIGHGGAIPTPMPGSPSHPQTSDLADGVLTGMELTAGGGMTVDISAGTYRINSDSYSISGGEVGYAVMDESDAMAMNETFPPAELGDINGDNYVYMDESDPPETMSETWTTLVLGIGDSSFTLDPAPAAGYFRYDAFQVGIDGVIDYLVGTAVTSSPAKPAISANHVQVGEYILVVGGTTEITDGDIGLVWTTPQAASLTLTPALDEFPWNAGNDYPTTTITVAVKDQYGNAYSSPRTFTLTMIMGTGTIYSGDTGWHASVVTQDITGSSYTFTYKRDETTVEGSPSFIAQASGDEGLIGYCNIVLLDVFGDEVEGNSSVGDYQDITSTAGAVTIVWSAGIKTEITMTEDTTFVFSEASHGDKLTLLIRQDAVGGWTPTLPVSVTYGTEITIEQICLDANSRSYLGFIYDSPTGSYDLVANVSGYV